MSIAASLDAAATALPVFTDTSNGISLLSLKTTLMIQYLANLSLYILCKTRNESHEVDELIDLRIYLEKIRPLETKLRYQIDKLIRSAERGAETHIEQESLSFKPNAKQIIIEPEIASDVYRPPRIAATAQRQERRRPNNTLREFVDSELSAAPQAEPSIGSNIRSHKGIASIQDRGERKRQQERDRYEEENYLRLPASKEKRARKDDVYGGEDFRVLEQEINDHQDSLLERSRKRVANDVDVDIGKDFRRQKKAFKRRHKGK